MTHKQWDMMSYKQRVINLYVIVLYTFMINVRSPRCNQWGRLVFSREIYLSASKNKIKYS